MKKCLITISLIAAIAVSVNSAENNFLKMTDKKTMCKNILKDNNYEEGSDLDKVMSLLDYIAYKAGFEFDKEVIEDVKKIEKLMKNPELKIDAMAKMAIKAKQDKTRQNKTKDIVNSLKENQIFVLDLSDDVNNFYGYLRTDILQGYALYLYFGFPPQGDDNYDYRKSYASSRFVDKESEKNVRQKFEKLFAGKEAFSIQNNKERMEMIEQEMAKYITKYDKYKDEFIRDCVKNNK